MDKDRNIKGLSGSTLKIAAMVCMVFDHIGAVILADWMFTAGFSEIPEFSFEMLSDLTGKGTIGTVYLFYYLFRLIIGRLAFPIFCFLLVEGFLKTSNRKKYIRNLFLFALLSEVPFDLALRNSPVDFSIQNVFFTLCISVLVLYVMAGTEKIRTGYPVKFLISAAAALAGMWAAEAGGCDYGSMGVISIVLLYLFRHSKREQIIAGCVSFLWEPTALLAFIPVSFYNGNRGLKLKYVFYAFYPAHLLIIYFITLWMHI